MAYRVDPECRPHRGRLLMAPHTKQLKRLAIGVGAAAGLFALSVIIYVGVCCLEKPGTAVPAGYTTDYTAVYQPEWSAPPPDFMLSARSAIMIDSASGALLYEKNADEAIPPASMTKLMTLYVAFKAADNGDLSLNDIVPLPPESWIRNLPPRSSGMLLEKGQRVTVLELMQGMAVASGNDAAVALAVYTAGSVENFCRIMNEEAARLGLVNTFFADTSGLSEKNTTTARDFVKFCRVYVAEYPQSIAALHRLPSMTYPKDRNMPPDGSGSFYNVTKRNTNRLLSLLDGCDGLKTGYIDESGYNLALTVKRGQMRIIAVIMGCPGTSTYEGDRNRISDSTALAEYAYRYFESVLLPAAAAVPVAVTGGERRSGRYVFAVETDIPRFVIPAGTADKITRTVRCPSALSAPLNRGDVIGSVVYSAGDTAIGSIPLAVDRDVAQGNALSRLYDRFYRAVAIQTAAR